MNVAAIRRVNLRRRTLLAGSALTFTLALTVPAAAAQGDVNKIVVINLKAPPEIASLGDDLSELLLGAVRTLLPDASIVGQSELSAMLALQQQKQQLSCDDSTACLAEIGGALGADHLVTGRLGKLGSVYLLNIQLIHTPTATVVGHASERVTGSDENLIAAIDRSAHKLFGMEAEAPAAKSPPTAPKDDSKFTATSAPPPAAQGIDAPSPWYTRWWVWTAGLGLLGGVAVLAVSGGGSDEASPAGGAQGSGTVGIVLQPIFSGTGDTP